MEGHKVKVIAFYLPQFHPIPENDNWWGKGFTEWTSVAKAKPLYRNHYQPHVPADLGFYDLRLSEVREAQAELAKNAGVTAFCYWHYWMGNGKQLLEMPFNEVVRLGKPDFPFCLAWANHSWLNKSWNAGASKGIIPKVLIEQTYPGKKDIDEHFYTFLKAFKDKRYLHIHGKLMFLIYDIHNIPDFPLFKLRWNELAENNDLPGFYFIANTEDISDLDSEIIKDYDAVSLCRIYAPWKIETSSIAKRFRFITRNISRIIRRPLNIISYAKAIKHIDTHVYEKDRVYPNIIPNWDNSPRRGVGAYMYKGSTPDLFRKHVQQTIDRISHKDDEDKVIFIKSWNEWAEGNYMEPDLQWGKKYLMALREVLDNTK